MSKERVAMKTRIHEWLLIDQSRGKRSTRLSLQIRYGVQVRDGGKWKHCHRNGKPLIFSTRGRAEREIAALARKTKAAKRKG
jgi:hypothetical protein